MEFNSIDHVHTSLQDHIIKIITTPLACYLTVFVTGFTLALIPIIHTNSSAINSRKMFLVNGTYTNVVEANVIALVKEATYSVTTLCIYIQYVRLRPVYDLQLPMKFNYITAIFIVYETAVAYFSSHTSYSVLYEHRCFSSQLGTSVWESRRPMSAVVSELCRAGNVQRKISLYPYQSHFH